MKKVFGYMTLAVICMAAGLVQAENSWVLYDDFNGQFMDIGAWTTYQRIDTGVTILEYVRKLHGGRLYMEDRAFGYTQATGPYSGQRAGDISSVFGADKVFKGMKVSVKVKEVEVTGCGDNPIPSSSRARLLGFFFNTDESYNGRLNDVVAQIRIQKGSNSTEGDRILEVWADVVKCTNSACTLGSGPPSILLGKVKLGQWATIEIDWDQDRSEFNFALNGNSSSISYLSQGWDPHPPSSPWNAVGLSNRLADCPVQERALGYIEAEFENLFVRQFE